ncbi:MAG: DsbA family protein [Gammaproteobacteria bacterium]|nr:DsbA family protein [Gammaproteobacteria bacterium]
MATLHYIYDPLCGWCYAAAPLVAAAQQHMHVVAHGGGMMAYDNRKAVTASLRNYVIPHDQRIAQLTGQPFGHDYYEGLLRDHDAVFDSEPPITAILAAEKLANKGLDLLSLIQKAHYVEGQRIAELSVLSKLATQIGLARDIFEDEYQNQAGAKTRAHILESRQLLQHSGGQGFPTFILERDGLFERINHAQYYGNLEEWRKRLATLQPNSSQTNELVNVCGIDGCVN